MSRGEAKVKVIAGALQPKGLDLTQYHRHTGRRPPKLRAADADGVLTFAGSDFPEQPDGDMTYGDPLPGILLRLKYADQHSKDLFIRGAEILLHRHGGMATKHGDTMRAVATTAVFEWVHDECPGCRAKRAAPKVRPCPSCFPKEGRQGAKPGCGKCFGMGRVFEIVKKSRGIRCIECHGSGRVYFKRKKRWSLVTDLVLGLQDRRGQIPHALSMKSFLDHWNNRYEKFLEILRRIDRDLGVGLDLGFRAGKMRSTVPIQEQDQSERYEVPPSTPPEELGTA